MTSSARQVAACTTPDPPSPRACWNAITAALVFGPNAPSTASLAPWACSRYCNDRTVACGQALLLPCRSSGQLGPLTAMAGTAIPAAPAASTAAMPAAPGACGTLALIEVLPISGPA